MFVNRQFPAWKVKPPAPVTGPLKVTTPAPVPPSERGLAASTPSCKSNAPDPFCRSTGFVSPSATKLSVPPAEALITSPTVASLARVSPFSRKAPARSLVEM